MTVHRELAIVGLGSMGGGLAAQAAEKGMRVVGVDPSGLPDELASLGVVDGGETPELAGKLAPPRVVLLYVPAGPIVDSVLDELAETLDPGDIVADGGNSYWGDSIRRHARLAERDIRFVDLGTSGGLDGARHGACFMAGGDREAVETIEPILRDLAVEGGYVHAGPPGAGHFVKLVHNGIEFGMLQAIGEGVDLLEHFDHDLPVADVLRCWRHGSVIRSWLVDLMEAQYRERGGTDRVPAYIEDTGEVNWLIADAMRMERPVPVISQAVVQLFASRDESREWARSIAMMRHGFGGHPFGTDESIRKERRRARVGPIRRGDESTSNEED
jgi:6-phosphogluconate dehydrogenase